MEPLNIVHGLERGRAPSSLPRNVRILETVQYDVIIPPTRPIQIGQRVQIRLLRELDEEEEMGSVWRRYESAPADVEGRVVGIRTMELAIAEFTVLNEIDQSLVKHAYLTVQYAHGTTVALTTWQRLLRTALLPLLPHTRHVPLERHALITLAEE